MWSPCGVLVESSTGSPWELPGLHADSTRTPPGLQVHFGCVPGISKCTWSPGGVPLESRWSTGSPRESTRNVWGSVKTSYITTFMHTCYISDLSQTTYTWLQVFSEHSHMSILIMFLKNSDKPQTHAPSGRHCRC